MATARYDVGSAVLDPRVINVFRPPVANGIRGYYRLEAQSVSGTKVVNLVNPQLSANIIGSPTIDASGMVFTGLSNYLDTLNSESASQTFIVVGNAVAISSTARPWIMGNFATTPSPGRGVGLYIDGIPSGQASPQGVVRANIATSVDGGTTVALTTATTNSVDVISPECLAAVWTQGVGLTVYNLTKGTQATVAAANPRVVSANTIRIGSSYANYTGVWKGRRAADYSRALTKAELDTMRAYWQSELASASSPLTGF